MSLAAAAALLLPHSPKLPLGFRAACHPVAEGVGWSLPDRTLHQGSKRGKRFWRIHPLVLYSKGVLLATILLIRSSTMPYSNLPKRLWYLQTVLERLNEIPPDQLNEDVDTSFLEAVFRERISGLPPAKAKRLLAADVKAMTSWLKTPGIKPASVQFVRGWLMGAQLFGSDNLVTSLVSLLSNLPPAPAGRQFGAVPVIQPFCSALLDDDGNVFLYIRSNAAEPNPVDVRVTIDGAHGIWDAFETDYSVFTRYRLRLSDGEHHLVVESERGQARLEEDVKVDDTLHIGITYWYSAPSRLDPELPPQLTLHAEQQPWIPDYGWKPRG